MPRGVAKANLPSRLCACCGRPFSWRKKWARDWEQVKFCSDACRRKGMVAQAYRRDQQAESQGEP